MCIKHLLEILHYALDCCGFFKIQNACKNLKTNLYLVTSTPHKYTLSTQKLIYI